MSRQLISNFARGEFGPELYGRVDVPQYAAGAKRIRNFIIQRYGGASFRPGLRFVHELDATKTYRLIPNQYSIEQAYVLVMGDERMNVAANGGMILEEDLKIVSATNGANITIEVPYHAYEVGDEIYFTGNEGMDELNGRFAVVTAVPDANHVTFAINSTGFGALTNSTGIVRSGAPTPPPAPEPPPPTPTPPPPPPPTTGGGGGGSSDPGGPGGSNNGGGYFPPNEN